MITTVWRLSIARKTAWRYTQDKSAAFIAYLGSLTRKKRGCISTLAFKNQ